MRIPRNLLPASRPSWTNVKCSMTYIASMSSAIKLSVHTEMTCIYLTSSWQNLSRHHRVNSWTLQSITLPFNLLTTKFPILERLLTLFTWISTDPAEDVVDMDRLSHHTLTVETVLNATSQVGSTDLPRNQSAQSATGLATGHPDAMVVNHHQRRMICRGAIMEYNVEPLDNTQDLARKQMPLTST